MMFRVAKWRPRQLLLAWSVYWVALVLAFLGPGMPALWRITRPGVHGTASASAGNGAFKLVIAEGTSTIWTRELGLATMALAIAVPPLILWAFWLRSQRTRRAPAAGGGAAWR